MKHVAILTTLCSSLVLASCDSDTDKVVANNIIHDSNTSETIASGTNNVTGGSTSIADNNQLASGNEMVQLAGKVADGYLVGATICLDKNLNDQCDPDEPSTISTIGGDFKLDVSVEDKNKYPIVAEVSEHTIDEDTNEAVGSAYTLSSPATIDADKPFVSPISHMVHHAMKQDAELKVDEAKQMIADKLGMTVDAIKGDFIHRAKTGVNLDQKTQAKKLHNHARRLARALAKATKKTKELTIALPPEEQKEITTLVMATLESILPSILSAPIVETDTGVDFTALNNTINKVVDTKANLPHDLKQMKATLKTQKDRRIAKSANVAELLAEELVSSYLVMNYGNKQPNKGELKEPTFIINSKVMKLNNFSMVSKKSIVFNFKTLALNDDLSNKKQASNIYSSEHKNWIFHSSQSACSLKTKETGRKQSIMSCAGNAVNYSLMARPIDISNRLISSVAYRQFKPVAVGYAKFPEGSKLINLKIKRLNNVMVSPVYTNSDTCGIERYKNNADNCNVVTTSNDIEVVAQGLDEVISSAELPVFNLRLPMGATLSLLDNHNITKLVANKSVVIGKWKETNYKGLEAYKLLMPRAYAKGINGHQLNRLMGNVYVVKQERAVRLAFEQKAGYVANKGLTLNRKAFDAFIESIEGFKNPAINELLQSLETETNTETSTDTSTETETSIETGTNISTETNTSIETGTETETNIETGANTSTETNTNIEVK